jgi:hypothetical protein
MQHPGRPPENIRDVTFREDTAASRTGSGPANLATIRAAIIAAIKDAGYLHIPEGRRDHTTPAEALRLHGLDQEDMKGHSRNTPEPGAMMAASACSSGAPVTVNAAPVVAGRRQSHG